MRILQTLVVTAVILSAVPASSHNYLPLDSGNHWTYRLDGGGLATMEMVGPAIVRGRATEIRHQVEPMDEYENYWSRDANGNVYIHGARNFSGGVGWAYEPPVLMLPPPLSVGQNWSSSFDVFDIDSGLYLFGPNDIGFTVVTAGSIALPVGSLFAWGIGQQFPVSFVFGTAGEGAQAEAAYTLLGRRIDQPNGPSGPGAAATDWYTNGVGVVQYGAPDDTPDGQFRLLNFSTAVPVSNRTWSGIKALFR